MFVQHQFTDFLLHVGFVSYFAGVAGQLWRVMACSAVRPEFASSRAQGIGLPFPRKSFAFRQTRGLEEKTVAQIGVVSMPFVQIAQRGPESGFCVGATFEGGRVDDGDNLEGEGEGEVGDGFAKG